MCFLVDSTNVFIVEHGVVLSILSVFSPVCLKHVSLAIVAIVGLGASYDLINHYDVIFTLIIKKISYMLTKYIKIVWM